MEAINKGARDVVLSHNLATFTSQGTLSSQLGQSKITLSWVQSYSSSTWKLRDYTKNDQSHGKYILRK